MRPIKLLPLLGSALALLALTAIILPGSPMRLASWPWSKPVKPEVWQTVQGSVTCSDVASLDGLGGTPAALTLTASGQTSTKYFPYKVTTQGFGSFKAPRWEGYKALVRIPSGQDMTTLAWKLSCWDSMGQPGSTSQDSFTVSRKDLSRTICSKRPGLIQGCGGKESDAWIGNCGFTAATANLDTAVSVTLTAVVNPPQTAADKLWAALSATNPLVGIAAACFPPRSLLNQQSRPTVPPTVSTLPPVQLKTLEPLAPQQAPPSGGTATSGSQIRSPLTFAVQGECTSQAGTLRAVSAGFTTGGTATIRAWYPDGRAYENLIHAARVHPDGTINWSWPCIGDPAGQYTTEVVDVATGRTTGRIAFTIAPAASKPSPTVPAPPPTPNHTVVEQSGSKGSPTFQDPTNASGQGPTVAPMSSVQVECKIKPARTIGSAQPDGYWYLIKSDPWNVHYYAVANTFWNGDVPGRLPYTHNTDWRVPDC